MNGANFEDAVIENECIYFFDNLLKAMCRASINNYDLEILAEYNDSRRLAIRRIYSFENFFLLIDSFSIFILLFDRDRKCYVSYEYDWEDELGEQRYFSFLWEDQICFLPADLQKSMVYFDVKLRKFSQTDSINKSLGETIQSLCKFPSIYKDTVSFAIQGTDQYIKYNLFTKQVELVDLKNSEIKLRSLLQTDESLIWILDNEMFGLICGEEINNIIKVQGELSYTRVCNLQNYVCLPPGEGNHLILIDKSKMEVKDIVLPLNETELKLAENKRSNFIKCIETESSIFLIPYGIKALLCIEKNTFKISRIHFHFNNYMKVVISRNIFLTKMVAERQEVNLNHFLKYISSHSDDTTEKNYTEGIGGNIWDAIRKNESN